MLKEKDLIKLATELTCAEVRKCVTIKNGDIFKYWYDFLKEEKYLPTKLEREYVK